MINSDVIQELGNKYQTTEFNIVREYCQHLFLSQLYLKEEAKQLLFKGGTALRLIWKSPRFSEDLDFSSFKITQSQIENLVKAALVQIEQLGMQTDILESKKTSGGSLAILEFKWERFSAQIQMEISTRSDTSKKGKMVSIASDYVPDYTVSHLNENDLVSEKIQALLTRGKPRDFFDLYFILRKGLPIAELFRKNDKLKKTLLNKIEKEKLDIKGELKMFLPVSHHNLLKNLNEVLINELKRSLA